MRNSGIKIDYLYTKMNTFFSSLAEPFSPDSAIPAQLMNDLNSFLPGCSDEELADVIMLCYRAWSNNAGEKSELVMTGPDNFRLPARKIQAAIVDLLSGAEKSITMTGYSVSDYFSTALDEIIRKSQQGVYVTLYMNDIKGNKDAIQRMLDYRSKFLRVYEYQKSGDDRMAALHAKLAVTDRRRFIISSANLSYHGMAGNIEMGIVMESPEKAAQIEDVLRQLRLQRIFQEYEAGE